MVLWQVIFWAVIAIGLIVVELCSAQLVSIWFAISAAITFGFAFTDISFNFQLLIFAVISAILIITTRPITKKIMDNKTVATNIDALIGCEGVVQIDVTQSVGGRVLVEGKDWSARTTDDDTIAIGSKCIIQEIKGVTLIVKPV